MLTTQAALPGLGLIRVEHLRLLGSSSSNCQIRPRDADAVSGAARCGAQWGRLLMRETLSTFPPFPTTRTVETDDIMLAEPREGVEMHTFSDPDGGSRRESAHDTWRDILLQPTLRLC